MTTVFARMQSDKGLGAPSVAGTGQGEHNLKGRPDAHCTQSASGTSDGRGRATSMSYMRAVRMGRSSKGPASGVSWEREGPAWSAAAHDEEAGRFMPCRLAVRPRPQHRPGVARCCPAPQLVQLVQLAGGLMTAIPVDHMTLCHDLFVVSV